MELGEPSWMGNSVLDLAVDFDRIPQTMSLQTKE